VRDVLERPTVSLLVDRWSEDWSELAWLRLHGRASLVDPEAVPGAVLAALREKYPQYRDHRLEARPMIAIAIQRATSWSAVSGRG
jgi:PPOX class probable F420-dependent enzyme